MMPDSVKPTPHMPRQAFDWTLEGLSAIGVVLLIVTPILKYPELPDTIPVHFSATGEPDGWGSREMIFMLPGLGVLLYGLMSYVGRKPYRFNYLWTITEENAPRQYALAVRMMLLLKCGIVWLQTYLVWLMLRTAEGSRDGLGAFFLPLIGVGLLGIMVWYFVRAQQLR